MSRRAYSEINLHITWHVKDNAAVLRDDIEAQLHRYLRRRTKEEPDVICREVGGTDDHVHLVVAAQPTLPISEWVGQMKGASAHYINNLVANRKVLEWQPGYGVVSFGTKDLPWVIEYVRNACTMRAARHTRAWNGSSLTTRGSPLKRARSKKEKEGGRQSRPPASNAGAMRRWRGGKGRERPYHRRAALGEVDGGRQNWMAGHCDQHAGVHGRTRGRMAPQGRVTGVAVCVGPDRALPAAHRNHSGGFFVAHTIRQGGSRLRAGTTGDTPVSGNPQPLVAPRGW
jgi:REP element-mobilizing transposase RayT